MLISCSSNLVIRAAIGFAGIALVWGPWFSFVSAAHLFGAGLPGTPQLNLIQPRGVQRGSEHTIQFLGARLNSAEEVFLYNSAGKISILGMQVVDANRVEVKIKVEADCRLGEHLVQIRTRDGISEFRSFFIGAMTEVEEKEPNNSQSEAQPIVLDTTTNGVVTNEDIDYFKFQGKQGERVSIEVEAIRLGYMFDPAVALLDSNRFEIAVSDDTPLTKQDCWLSVLLPEDGEYFVAVRESSFRGNGECRYRLHVGRFGRPTAVYPAGGKPGEKVKLRFLEQLAGATPGFQFVEQEVTLPSEEEAGNQAKGIFFQDGLGISPSPVPFRFSNFENIMEPEGNVQFPEKPVVDFSTRTDGVVINGIVNEGGHLDFYRFTAKQNQVWNFKCEGRSIGSSIDPVINIYNSQKQVITGNDDSAGPDSFLRFQVPADGDYFVMVRDHMNRMRPDFIYRLEISPAKPSLKIGIQRNDRYSQNRQTIAVPQGNRFAVLVNAERNEFGGELQLSNEGLPPGIAMHAVPMVTNLTTMPVVFEATGDAAIGGKLVDFRARHVDSATGIEGGFKNFSDFVLGEPNNQVYYGATVDKLAMAVIEPLPFRLEIVQPKVPLVRNGLIYIKVIAQRNEGFDQAITIFFPFLPPGTGTSVQQTIPQGQTEFSYPVNANGSAQLGTWPMYVIGSCDVNGPAWASTQLAQLVVAEPFVSMAFDRASVDTGQATKLHCKIEQLIPFDGEATAEILAIPPNVTVQTPLKFNKDTGELSFDVQTTAESPVGKHGLFCQVTIMKDGEPIVFRTGDIQLQINKPLPPPVTPPVTTLPEP
jgi:hypothetical protein